MWNKIYRADAVKEIRFDKQDGASEDIMFNDRVSANISTCVCMDEPKYHYIRRVGAITVSEFGYGAFSIVRAMNIFLENMRTIRRFMTAQSWATLPQHLPF